MAWRSPLVFNLPTPAVGIPSAIREQTIQIGKVTITVDKEIQSFAVVLARPLAIPCFPSRIIAMEERTAERLPAAMRTAFDVAASTMALANRRTAIGTGSEFRSHSGSSVNVAEPDVSWSILPACRHTAL